MSMQKTLLITGAGARTADRRDLWEKVSRSTDFKPHDQVADNIDVAIRFGELEDSSVVATKVGRSVRYVVATPEYLKGRTLPAGPDELKLHDCVMLNAKHNETDWDLVSGRSKARVHVSGPISSRDFNSVSTFVLRGHGVGLLPSTYCDEALAGGRLVRLLPKWTSPQIPVFTVYPSRKFLPSRLRVFLEALAAWKSPLWTRDEASGKKIT